MRTIRRLYVYLVTLISLELVVWGLVNLLQTSLSPAPASARNLLASGLSLVLVGLPIFVLHGWLAQREARRDLEEQASRVRALFHYAARLVLLVPVIFQLFDQLRSWLEGLFGVPEWGARYPGATLLDRLIAMAVNLAAWYLLERLLRSDWRAAQETEALVEVRRLSRYIWMLLGLSLLVAGVLQVLLYVLNPVYDQVLSRQAGLGLLANGLTLLLLGLPLWVYCWRVIQQTCDLPGERPSLLRLVVFYALCMGAALSVLFSVQFACYAGFSLWLEGRFAVRDLLAETYQPLAFGLVLGGVWAYFGRQLHREWSLEPDDLRRAGLRRLYYYPLALAGNAAVFSGAWQLLGMVVELGVAPGSWGTGLRRELSGALSWLVTGLPFWLGHWPRMHWEARQREDAGDHARRSILRKSYLYLAVFLSVVALMSAAGFLFYQLINAALGNASPDLALEAWQQVRTLGLVAIWLAYHLGALRADGRLALAALGRRQAAFGVLVFLPGQPDLAAGLRAALARQLPLLPVIFIEETSALAGRASDDFHLLVLPAALALDPPAELAGWLAGYAGQRLLLPLPAEGWAWAGVSVRSTREWVLETLRVLRTLSEGQLVRPAPLLNPWALAGWVLGGLFAAVLSFSFLMSFFFGLR